MRPACLPERWNTDLRLAGNGGTFEYGPGNSKIGESGSLKLLQVGGLLIGVRAMIFGTLPQINHNFLGRYPINLDAERQKYIFGRNLDQMPA